MLFSIKHLAELSGLTKRTLRYYDEIGLLVPSRIEQNGYRYYSQSDVDKLQQIMFYKAMDLSLHVIKQMITAPSYEPIHSLEKHLLDLHQKKVQMELLIKNVELTIDSLKGGYSMDNDIKFNSFKQSMIIENERLYGEEVREKYGYSNHQKSINKVNGLTEEQWKQSETLRVLFEDTLQNAINEGNPSGEAAQKACDLHRQWLMNFWSEDMYSKVAHRNLGEMYAIDERFKEHYDRIGPNGAMFLRDSLIIYTNK